MPTEPIYTQGVSKKPLVSFIVPIYNLPASLVTECLDSILTLSLDANECEIIVVDDGSSAPLLNDLCEYWNRIIYIRQTNRGLSEARNTGMRLAQGKYIQFVDGDDALLSFVYEHCLDMIRYHDADVVVYNFVRTKQQKTAYDVQGPMLGSEYMSKKNLHASACCILFKQSLLQGLQFTQGLLNEDEEFTPQLILSANKLYETNARAYYYRKRKNSCTTRKDTKNKIQRLHDTLFIILKFQSQLDALPLMERNALQRRIAQLTMDYIYNVAQYTHSIEHLNKSIEELKTKGLYPLPNKKYTRNYSLFRRFIQTKIGRRMLILMALK